MFKMYGKISDWINDVNNDGKPVTAFILFGIFLYIPAVVITMVPLILGFLYPILFVFYGVTIVACAIAFIVKENFFQQKKD